jgi:hypothetical protein
MTAAKRDFYIEQGATFSRGFFWYHPKKDAQGNIIKDSSGKPIPGEPYVLTGWRARMQIRQSVEDEAIITATTSEDNTGTKGAQIVFGLDPDHPEAAADPSNGRIDIRLSADATDLLSITYGVYDLKVYDPGETEYRLLEGNTNVSPAVTRDDAPVAP